STACPVPCSWRLVSWRSRASADTHGLVEGVPERPSRTTGEECDQRVTLQAMAGRGHAFMMAGDPIRVVPYDSAWPLMFARQAADLRDALGAVALRIDHIGSTAIPRLAAKPVIDSQISVADFEPLDAYRAPLERLGYVFRADNLERTKRYFRDPPGQRRTHIHVRRAGSFSEQFAL